MQELHPRFHVLLCDVSKWNFSSSIQILSAQRFSNTDHRRYGNNNCLRTPLRLSRERQIFPAYDQTAKRVGVSSVRWFLVGCCGSRALDASCTLKTVLAPLAQHTGGVQHPDLPTFSCIIYGIVCQPLFMFFRCTLMFATPHRRHASSSLGSS